MIEIASLVILDQRFLACGVYQVRASNVQSCNCSTQFI